MNDVVPTDAPDGRLVENVVHFVRALRKAGMRVGTSQVETAIRALAAAGFTHRTDFYHILRATLVTRADDLEIYHQVFSMFWRDPDFLQTMMYMMSPKLRDDRPPPPKEAAGRRAADAFADRRRQASTPPERQAFETEALLSWSERAVLRAKDFEQMSAAELAEAERAIRALALPLPRLRSRRKTVSTRGRRADMRATLRLALRRAGEVDRIVHRVPRSRPPDIVAICDISGSMSVYSRIILRFLHAMEHAGSPDWGRLHAFTFGTELTNVSRPLARPDPDLALAAIGQEASDWEGGTRIGAALERFNKDWSRRVLGRGAVVLLITDGLERGDTALLDAQMERLALSSRAVIWLNPLLRYDGFAPKARGIRAMLGHVTSLHSCHSLDTLADLVGAFGDASLKETLRRVE